MNGQTELLNFIYQNAEMGVMTLGQLIDVTHDKALSQRLRAQYEEYEWIHQTAREKLNAGGYAEKGLSAPERIKTYLTVGANTLSDKSPSHIAELLISGGNMGIIDGTKRLKQHSNIQADVRALLRRLIESEENNVERLKAFL